MTCGLRRLQAREPAASRLRSTVASQPSGGAGEESCAVLQRDAMEQALARVGELEREVAQLRDENLALRRCLEACGVPPEALAAQTHRVRFEKLLASHVRSGAAFDAVLSLCKILLSFVIVIAILSK